MVIETVDEREKTAKALFATLQDRASSKVYADDIADVLKADGTGAQTTLWTIWRLIDENRLFLDDTGHLVVEMPDRDE